MNTVRITCGEVRDLLSQASGAFPFTGETTSSSSFTGVIAGSNASGSILTASAVTGILNPGNVITATGVAPNTFIMEQLTGTAGGAGTYRLNKIASVASIAMTSDGRGLPIYKDGVWTTFQAIVQGTGSVSATVVIEGSNDGVNFCNTPIGTIVLAGTTTFSDGFTTMAPWKFVRANVTAISGTGATVTCLLGN